MVNEGGKPELSDFNSKFMTLGILLGMQKHSIQEAKRLYDSIEKHPQWHSYRSNDALMVDCLYIKGRQDSKLTQQKVIEVTKDIFGKGTQPKPHLWRDFYEAIC